MIFVKNNDNLTEKKIIYIIMQTREQCREQKIRSIDRNEVLHVILT